jgi:hypothetical protein
MGLREQIKTASSEAEITELLTKGKKFEWASERTQSSWKSTARFRLAEISNPVAAKTPEKPMTNKKQPKKKTK